MPSASQLYASGRWLNASDLLPLNQRRTAIVTHCEPEQVGIGSDAKTMLMLELQSKQGAPWPKKLPLNKGNSMQMIAGFGDDYSLWNGKAIEVWAENVMFQGKLVPGLKVQPAPNGAATQAALPPANPSPSASAVTGAQPVAGPNWSPPKQTSIDDDDIPF